MIRAFVAIDLPSEVRQPLEVLQFLLPLPRRVPPEQFHITLAFLDTVPDAVLEALHESLCTLPDVAFPLELSGVGLFGGARPTAIWAGVAPSEPLDRLQARVARMAHVAGARLPDQRFVPHVTLGRIARATPEVAMRLERAVVEHTLFHADPFDVREVVLYASDLTPAGARHRELARYSLRG